MLDLVKQSISTIYIYQSLEYIWHTLYIMIQFRTSTYIYFYTGEEDEIKNLKAEENQMDNSLRRG